MVPNSEMITLRAGKGVRTSMPMGQSQPAGSRSGAGHDLVLKGNARVVAELLRQAGHGIEGRRLAGIGIADERQYGNSIWRNHRICWKYRHLHTCTCAASLRLRARRD